MVAVLKEVVVALACASQLTACISSSRGLRRDRWLLVWRQLMDMGTCAGTAVAASDMAWHHDAHMFRGPDSP